MRLLTYNVRSLRDDVQAVGAVIRAAKADVVCVQEAPRFLRWRSKRAALARTGGLVVATDDRLGGLAVFTDIRCRVAHREFVALSRTPGLHARALTWVDVDVDGQRWRVASMHLGLRADERLRHVDEIVTHLERGAPDRVVLAGDVNDEPGSPVWAALTRHFVEAGSTEATFPARSPRQRIDGVFVSSAVSVESCVVPDLPGVAQGSDHRPVLAELQ
jgi:endonuclease/exonuclease/phosphatase family metal-dependent hydrolase